MATIEKDENRSCIECGTKLSGRIDKKFCDDLCRNIYNNAVKQREDREVLLINNILKKNRRILKSLTLAEGSAFKVINLKKLGFNFDFYTYTNTSDGSFYFYCYEFGYTYLTRDSIQIVRQSEID